MPDRPSFLARTFAIALVAVACSAAFYACDARSPKADDAAVNTPPRAHPQPTPRLVVLSPGLASILRELDRERLIVGRHNYDTWSDQSIAPVGDNLRLNTEALIDAEPTHILLQDARTQPPPGLNVVADQTDAAVTHIPVLTLADLPAAVRTVDRLSRGRPAPTDDATAADEAPSPQAQRLLDRLDAAFAHDPAAANFGRTLVIASTDPIGVTGPGSFHHDIVNAIGATALPTTGSPWQTLNAEDVAALNPSTIILFTDRPAADPAVELPAVASVLPDLFATDRVIIAPESRWLLPGPPLIGFAEHLKAAARALPSPAGPPTPTDPTQPDRGPPPDPTADADTFSR